MKKVQAIFALIAFIGVVFFACSTKENGIEYGNFDDSSSSSVNAPGVSSSSSFSSSSKPPSGEGCTYQPSWCGGIAFSDIDFGSKNNASIGGDDDPGHSHCIFATSIANMANESISYNSGNTENAGLLVNGVALRGQDGKATGGRCGKPEWKPQTPCAEALANVQKADGGYYIYVKEWAGEFTTVGGTPVCGNNGNGSSSSANTESDGNCAYQSSWCNGKAQNTIPAKTPSFDAKNGDCFFVTGVTMYCAWGSGQEASKINGVNVGQGNIGCWGSNATLPAKADGGYYIMVGGGMSEFDGTAGSAPACGGSAGNTSSLTCTGLPPTGTVGSVVLQPTVKCGNTTLTTKDFAFTDAPVWNSPTTEKTHTVSVSASSGTCSGKTESCGSITIAPKPALELTCTNMPTTGTAGTAIATPTVRCGTTTLTTSIDWSGTPSAPNWNSPAANTYTNIKATAFCDGNNPTANCSGTLVVSQSGTTPSYPPLVQGQNGAQKGYATRYWDACKANCSWSGKPQALGGNTRCKNCSINGTTEIAASDANKSSCDGGNAYTCFDQVPWSVSSTLSYGFAATPGGGSDCGKCYQLQFTGVCDEKYGAKQCQSVNGKTMIVISSNIGYDVAGGQFDIMIPGGGVGEFDAFSKQLTNLGVSNLNLGAQYGGFLAECNYNKSCVAERCASHFANIPLLKSGCDWFVDWLDAANNPGVLYKQVDCPQALIDKYKATMF